MFVRITKCSRPTYWYADAVGAEVEVKPHEAPGFWEVIDENNEEPWKHYMIHEDDFEIIEN